MRPENKYLCVVSPKKKVPWVMRDEKIFQSIGFNVKNSLFSLKKTYFLPFQFIKQFFYLFYLRSKCNLIVCQGAGYHSFAPALLSKLLGFKLIIVAIGTDCVSYPTLNYGSYRKKLYGFVTKYSFKKATKVCPVHSSLIYYENSFYPEDIKNQGLKSFVPELKSSHLMIINNGFDSKKWINKNNLREDNTFLTVVGEINKQTYFLKGIDLIIEFAKNQPSSKITIVGTHSIHLEKLDNVNYIPFISQTELLDIYNHHKYYLQLSLSEGLPNSLCEAMLSGCIPIGSANSSIPEIIGKKDNIVSRKSLSKLNETIRKLQTNQLNDKPYFRERIISNYPLEKRKEQFEQLFREIQLQ
jgi:glycosyltransferase involved in cell wall biosynthesis